MELGNPEITGAVVTISAVLYKLFPNIGTQMKVLLPILIGALIGVCMTDMQSVQTVLVGATTGLMSGVYGSGGVAVADKFINKAAPVKDAEMESSTSFPV